MEFEPEFSEEEGFHPVEYPQREVNVEERRSTREVGFRDTHSVIREDGAEGIVMPLDIRTTPIKRKECPEYFDFNQEIDPNLPEETKEFLALINNYKPLEVIISTNPRPIIPKEIPATGEIAPQIQIPRPDGIEEKLYRELDESLFLQSDPLDVTLELEMNSKRVTRKTDLVKTITNHKEQRRDVWKWIERVEKTYGRQKKKEYSILDLDHLMKSWDVEYENILKDKGIVKIAKYVHVDTYTALFDTSEFDTLLRTRFKSGGANPGIMRTIGHSVYKFAAQVVERNLQSSNSPPKE